MFETFDVTNGVKQKCVLPQTDIFLIAIVDEAFQGIKGGASIQSRQDIDLPNDRNFKARLKNIKDYLYEL